MADKLTGKRIFVAGHRGMVGRALVRRLGDEPCDVVLADRNAVDLTDQAAVYAWMRRERPDMVFLAAAKVGGIVANRDFPADFLRDNLLIAVNVVEAAHHCDVEKLVFLGSSVIYPKDAPQPISESSVMTGPLDESHLAYATAKIAGLHLCQAYRAQHGRDFITAILTNLYGPSDNFDLETGHVLPVLMRRVHEAKQAGAPCVTIWGTGTPRREFLHVEDCADALIHLMRHYSDSAPVNIGSGEEVSILELAALICDVVGYEGAIVTDPTKPDGTRRKLLRSDRLAALGWRARIDLREGVTALYREFRSSPAADR